MYKNKKQAILVVSFGTSYADTRKKTIDVIREEIRTRFPDYPVYEAWTSGMIIRKVKERDGYQVDTVTEALERMLQDGVTDLIVQPTHMINGIENDIMKQDVMAKQDAFASITFGNPLLTNEDDSFSVIRALMDELEPISQDTALVLMGHGTSHYVNPVYAALDYQFKEQGFANVFVGTVEEYPGLETLKKILRERHFEKLVLAPLMIVAGDHAKNDMASEEEDSWKSQFEQAGYQVRCILKGLGEYCGVRELFIKHIDQAIQGSCNY